MNDLSATRLNWHPTPEDWIRFGTAYRCHDFTAAMLAVVARDASREVEAATWEAERDLARAKVHLETLSEEPSSRDWAKDFKRLEADRRNAFNRPRDSMGNPVPWTEAEEKAWRTKTEFDRYAKEHKLAGDLKAWARKGRDWQLEITGRVQLYHERTMEMRALEYRRNIADAARALVDAVNAPLDPHARLLALSDIKRHGSIEPDALESSISEVAILAFAARKASDEFAEEVGEEFVGGSPWGQFVLNMRAFAKRNNLPHQIGRSTPDINDRYADFAEFLWALQGSMPEHLRRNIEKSTFVRYAKGSVRCGKKFAAENERLEAAKNQPDAIMACANETSQFAELDRLAETNPIAYEKAIAQMSEAEFEAYLAEP